MLMNDDDDDLWISDTPRLWPLYEQKDVTLKISDMIWQIQEVKTSIK